MSCLVFELNYCRCILIVVDCNFVFEKGMVFFVLENAESVFARNAEANILLQAYILHV